MSDLALLRKAVQAHRDYYDDLSKTWRDLDSKAQNSVPLVGILLTAFVAFVARATALRCVADRVLAILEIVLLTSSAVLYVVVLSVRECDYPPYSGDLQDWLKGCLPLGSAARPAALRSITVKELDGWKGSTDSIEGVMQVKVRWLRSAQFVILAAVVVLALFSVIQILEQ